MIINKIEIEAVTDGFFLFSTVNCPTCHKLKQLCNKIELDVTINELDAYKHPKICQQLGLIGTPCLIDIREGKEYDRMYGAPSQARVEAFLKGE